MNGIIIVQSLFRPMSTNFQLRNVNPATAMNCTEAFLSHFLLDDAGSIDAFIY
jgi:hypothetical protein